MYGPVILIVIIVLFCTCFFYYYCNNLNSKNYGVVVKIDESTCMKKPGQDVSRRRCTYRCDDQRGCIHKGKIQKGVFYGVEECNSEEKISGW